MVQKAGPCVSIIEMSNIGHLQQNQLGASAVKKLQEFGEWLYTAKFQDMGGGLQRCVDPELQGKMEPVIEILEISSLV
jgi:hypothetical protein